MKDHELASKLLQDHFTATAALIALMLKNVPDDVRTRAIDAVSNGTGKELNARGVERDRACARADGWVRGVVDRAHAMSRERWRPCDFFPSRLRHRHY